uniref:Uncharacterized protein n=1 Tax=Oryza sativa subsp. japonica TaxID=39947 RepID=Q656K1_ORYSJ|nr:hypothetical protein [Oryza sativa Japonica Group]
MAGSSSSRSTTQSVTEISRQGTTPYLKQVLNDLVSTVREVKTENSEIRASLANSRAVIDGLVTERNVYEAKSMGQKEECGSFAEMAYRIKI